MRLSWGYFVYEYWDGGEKWWIICVWEGVLGVRWCEWEGVVFMVGRM